LAEEEHGQDAEQYGCDPAMDTALDALKQIQEKIRKIQASLEFASCTPNIFEIIDLDKLKALPEYKAAIEIFQR